MSFLILVSPNAALPKLIGSIPKSPSILPALPTVSPFHPVLSPVRSPRVSSLGHSRRSRLVRKKLGVEKIGGLKFKWVDLENLFCTASRSSPCVGKKVGSRDFLVTSATRHSDKTPSPSSEGFRSIGNQRPTSTTKRNSVEEDLVMPKKGKQISRTSYSSSGLCYVQILGTGMDMEDTTPSVLLFFDQKRFIFNAGEGMQRFCVEHKIKLSKMDHVFFTRVNSETAGGLPGLLLTLANIDEKGRFVKISGPSNLQMLTDAMRTFVPGAAMVDTFCFGQKKKPSPNNSPSRTFLDVGKDSSINRSSAQFGNIKSKTKQLSDDVKEQDTDVKMSDDLNNDTFVSIYKDELVEIWAEILTPVPETKPNSTIHASKEEKLEDIMDNKVVREIESVNIDDSRVKVEANDNEINRTSDSEKSVSETKVLGPKKRGRDMLLESRKKKLSNLQEHEPPKSRERSGEETNERVSDPTSEDLNSSNSSSEDLSVVYICRLHKILGKFDPLKAQQLGLKPSAKYRMLQSGESVLSDDGKLMIHPEDVMDKSSPGPIFMIIDCPSISHIPSLLSSNNLKQFHSYQNSAASDEEKQVTCIIHLSPRHVVIQADYQKFMNEFGEKTHHILAGHSEHIHPPVLHSSARLTTKLNFLFPHFFPADGIFDYDIKKKRKNNGIPNPAGDALTDVGEKKSDKLLKEDDVDAGVNFRLNDEFTNLNVNTVTLAKNLMKFHLKPLSHQGIDISQVPFPFSRNDVERILQHEIPEISTVRNEISEKFQNFQNSQNLNLARPKSPRKTKKSKKNSSDDVKEEILSVEGEVLDANASILPKTLVSEKFSLPESLRDATRDEMEIVFLGTGSSQPSKYRNVSSIFLNFFDKGGIFLDCGEGTYAQLKRRYGKAKADDLLLNLKCIWVSHIHADHHAGLARILSAKKNLQRQRSSGPPSPTLVIGPKPLQRFLSAYEKLENLGSIFLDCSQTTDEAHKLEAQTSNLNSKASETNLFSPRDNSEGNASPKKLKLVWGQSGFNLRQGLDTNGRKALSAIMEEMGLAKLVSVPVVHCAHAFGIVIQKGENDWSASSNSKNSEDEVRWKLVYSGDTRPCKSLMEASRNATVLIHEATFDDGLTEEALSKKHSLTKEAIETGIQANVYRTILTHFSQRYPKIPVFDASYNDRTCIAFDMMTVNLADLGILPALLSPLKLLFKNEMEGLEGEEEDD